MRITLTNDYHGTEVQINASLGHIDNAVVARLTRNQIAKSRRVLCGIANCQCGENEARTRGPQSANGNRLVVNCDAIYRGAKR